MDHWRGLWREGPGWVLVFVSLGWFATLGIRIVYPALLPEITREFALSLTMAGGLVSVLWVAYALFQFPGGVLADAWGSRNVLVLSLIVTLAAVVAIVGSPVLGLFALATVLLGIGTGLYGTTRVTVLSQAFPDRDATAITVSQASGNVGNIVLPVTAGLASVVVGWRLGFGVLFPLFVATAIGIWLVVPHTQDNPSNPGGMSFVETMRDVAGAITHPRVLRVTGVLTVTMFVYQSVTGFLPTYLVTMKGFTTGTAAVVFGLFFTGAIVFQFVSGTVADRVNRRFATAVFLALAIPAFVLLPLATHWLSVILVVILLSAVLGSFPPSHAYAVRSMPQEIQGSGYGLVRTLYIGMGAAGPIFVGVLADAGFFDTAFLALGGIVLAGALLTLTLPVLE